MISRRLIFPLARAYAAHAGVRVADEEIRVGLGWRLALMPWWARAYMALGAVFVRRLSPLIILGKPGSFEGLASNDRERLLERLQYSPRLPLKAAFFGVKSLCVAVCYGRPAA